MIYECTICGREREIEPDKKIVYIICKNCICEMKLKHETINIKKSS